MQFHLFPGFFLLLDGNTRICFTSYYWQFDVLVVKFTSKIDESPHGLQSFIPASGIKKKTNLPLQETTLSIFLGGLGFAHSRLKFISSVHTKEFYLLQCLCKKRMSCCQRISNKAKHFWAAEAKKLVYFRKQKKTEIHCKILANYTDKMQDHTKA